MTARTYKVVFDNFKTLYVYARNKLEAQIRARALAGRQLDAHCTVERA